MSHYLSSRNEHLRTDEQRAAESHTEYAARTLGFKPTSTLAQNMGGGGGQAAAASSTQGAPTAAAAGFAPAAPSGPQTGKVVSITRAEVFGTTQTVLRVLLDKGGERTVRVNANEGPVKVAMDIAEGDQVRLNPTGPAQWEWAKVVAVADKVRKKRKVFGPSTLLSEHGLVKLYTHFPSVRWETRPLYESRALSQIVSMYKEWAFAMWPKMSFPLLVDRIATLGNKALVREVVTDLRYGKEIDWEQLAEDADNTIVLKDGEEADPNSAAGRRKAKQVQLTANAAEIFEAFTGAKQPGIRTSKDAAAAAAAAAASMSGPGLFDDDQANDDDLNDLLDALGSNGGAPAAAAAGGAPSGLSKGAQLARDAKAALDRKKSAVASETELLLEKRIREQMDNADDFDPLARPVNPWEEARSKAAETAAKASERAARAAEAAAAEAAAPARRNNAKKRRATHLDDSDDEEPEAVMAPLSAGREAQQQQQVQQEQQSATIDAVAAAEAQSAVVEQHQSLQEEENALMSSGVEGVPSVLSSASLLFQSSSSSASAAAVLSSAEGAVAVASETNASLSLELTYDASQTAEPAAAAASTAEGAPSTDGAAAVAAADSQPLDTDEDALAAFLEQDARDDDDEPAQQQEGAVVPMETGDATGAAAASAETQAPTQQLAD